MVWYYNGEGKGVHIFLICKVGGKAGKVATLSLVKSIYFQVPGKVAQRVLKSTAHQLAKHYCSELFKKGTDLFQI
jgi:hypothetical protein